MMYLTKKYRLIIWGVSVIEAAALLLIAILTGLYEPVPPYYVPLNSKFNNVVAICIVIALLSPSMAEYVNIRFIKTVNREISVFIRDALSGVSSGLTLIKALEEAANALRGPVSREVRRALGRFALGEDLSKSLRDLGGKLRTPDARQLSSILASAYESGVKTPEILSTAEEFFRTISEYREERSAKIKPYLFVFYLAMAILLIVSYFSLNSFLIPILTSPTATILPITKLSPEYLKSLFFYLAILESLFAGLLCGKIAEGKLVAGLTHALILMAVTIVFFNLMIF